MDRRVGLDIFFGVISGASLNPALMVMVTLAVVLILSHTFWVHAKSPPTSRIPAKHIQTFLR